MGLEMWEEWFGRASPGDSGWMTEWSGEEHRALDGDTTTQWWCRTPWNRTAENPE